MDWFESAEELLEKWKAQEKASQEFWRQFTPRALTAIDLARKEAKRLHLNYIGTDHILFGLTELRGGVATNVLKNLGLNFANVRAGVEKLAGIGSAEQVSGNIPFTQRTKKVLKTAMEEAKTLNHGYTGTEHLYLGLLHESEGPAAVIFKIFEVDVELVRKKILDELNPLSN
jgi:ATP-dependent Clp protease ATP-binding subunit ClpC